MKKYLLLAVIAGSLIIGGCKKKSKEDNPFELGYSNLTTEQHKQELENSGRELVQKLDALPDQKFIGVFDYLTELAPEIEASEMNTVFGVSNAAKKTDVRAVFRSVTTSTTPEETTGLSEVFGVYTWDRQAEEWVRTPSNDRLEYRFPATATATSNNATLTFTYTASKSSYGEGIELPGSTKVVLKVDAKEEFSFSTTYSYLSDGTPKGVEMDMGLGVYAFKIGVSNSGSGANSNLSFSKGSEKLLAFTTSAKGNTTIGDVIGSEDVESILNNANATFEIMNLKLVGAVDFRAEAEIEKAWDELDEQKASQKEAEILNKYSQFVAINTTSNSVIAKGEWVAIADSYDGYTVEPRLVFKDNSKQSIGDFFENGFTALIDELEDFGKKF